MFDGPWQLLVAVFFISALSKVLYKLIRESGFSSQANRLRSAPESPQVAAHQAQQPAHLFADQHELAERGVAPSGPNSPSLIAPRQAQQASELRPALRAAISERRRNSSQVSSLLAGGGRLLDTCCWWALLASGGSKLGGSIWPLLNGPLQLVWRVLDFVEGIEHPLTDEQQQQVHRCTGVVASKQRHLLSLALSSSSSCCRASGRKWRTTSSNYHHRRYLARRSLSAALLEDELSQLERAYYEEEEQQQQPHLQRP